MRKSWLAVLTVLMLLGALAKPVWAANGVSTRGLGHAYKVYRDASHWHRENDFDMIYYNGETAFCLEPLTFLSLTAAYSPGQYADWGGLDAGAKAAIELALRYGYCYPGHQSDRYYMATQQLIWSYAGAVTTFYAAKANYSRGYGVDPELNEIKRLIAADAQRPAFDGQDYEQEAGVPLELAGLAGYELDHCSENLAVRVSGDTLTATLSGPGQGEAVFRRGAAREAVRTITTAVSSAQDLVVAAEDCFAASYVSLKVHSPGKESLQIIKKDRSSGKVIARAGTGFTLTGPDGQRIPSPDGTGTFYTDADGTILIQDLAYGDYVLTETKAPEGYQLSEEPVSFRLDGAAELLSVEALDQPILGKIIIHKTAAALAKAAAGKAVPGARYQIRLADGTVKGEGFTGSDGSLEFPDLPLGSYQVEEIAAPEGFARDPQVYPVTLSAADPSQAVAAQRLEVTDERLPLRILLAKELETSRFILPQDAFKGTLIGLYADEELSIDGQTIAAGQQLGAYTPEGMGLAIDLPAPGKYYFRELQAGDGYQLDPECYRFTAAYGMSAPAKITIVNRLRRLPFRFRKTDPKGQPLAGAAYGLFYDKEAKEKLAEAVSGADGWASFAGLEPGKYYLKELRAPKGFALDERTYEVQVTDEKAVNYLVLNDSKLPDTGNKANGAAALIGLIPLALLGFARRFFR